MRPPRSAFRAEAEPTIGAATGETYSMLRTLGIWIIAAAAVTSVALQVEERGDREAGERQEPVRHQEPVIRHAP